MEEIGIGVVNKQAEDVRAIVYPDWAGPGWRVGAKQGTDDKGYDLYELFREEERIVVPSNRVLMMKHIAENWE